jgi:hypothetical protein
VARQGIAVCAGSLHAIRLVAASSCGAERAIARVTRSRGHVAIDQRVGEVVWCGLELAAQLPGETAFSCFDDGAGMVGDQAAEHGLGVLDIAQIPRAVEGMETGGGEPGCVADVVQDGGGLEQVGVLAKDGGEGPGRVGDPLYVRPTARQWFLEK